MKLTILNGKPEDLIFATVFVREYRKSGYDDGSRPRPRNCVIYGDIVKAAVWGGPDHIRVSFLGSRP